MFYAKHRNIFLLKKTLKYFQETDVTIDLGKQSLPKLTLHEPNTQHSWGFDYLRCKDAFDYILHNKTVNISSI